MLHAHLCIDEEPLCAAPACKRRVRDPESGVWILRHNTVVGFCSEACYEAALAAYGERCAERSRVKTQIGKRDLLKELRFTEVVEE